MSGAVGVGNFFISVVRKMQLLRLTITAKHEVHAEL
jgi:hypothetical protein